MAEPETPDLMDYQALAQEALRGVVRAALERAATPEGLPGAHHLYISFRSTAPGVSLPPDLLARYPEDMTIVLQHQFWDLEVGQQGFSVMLKFGGSPKRLQIPYAAVTRFLRPQRAVHAAVRARRRHRPGRGRADRGGGRLHPPLSHGAAAARARRPSRGRPTATTRPPPTAPRSVSLDRFREEVAA